MLRHEAVALRADGASVDRRVYSSAVMADLSPVNYSIDLDDQCLRPAPGRALVQQLRPRQWVKNLACLAGVIFSGRLLVPEHLLQAGLAVASYSAASSAIYIFNDFCDREKDRRNPRTASRPLASGTLPLWLAGLAFATLLGFASASALALGTGCVLTLASYAILNISYSLRLKQAVIADVMCIALGFVLRVLYGVYAVGVLPTAWIILCMFFLALFLGFGKRKAELAALGEDSVNARPVLQKYSLAFLDLMLAISATLTIVCYALFTVVPSRNPTLILTIVPVVYCMTRYLLQIMVHTQGESPDGVLLTDWRMGVGILSWLGLCVAILYGNIHLIAPLTT